LLLLLHLIIKFKYIRFCSKILYIFIWFSVVVLLFLLKDYWIDLKHIIFDIEGLCVCFRFLPEFLYLCSVYWTIIVNIYWLIDVNSNYIDLYRLLSTLIDFFLFLFLFPNHWILQYGFFLFVSNITNSTYETNTSSF
jgi:hypothetical protein